MLISSQMRLPNRKPLNKLVWTFLGPSATGKTSLVLELTRLGLIHDVISCTTRKPRPGEVHDTHYHFMESEAFHSYVSEGQFAEYIEFNGNFYGIRKEDIDLNLSKGSVGMAVEPNGYKQIKTSYGHKVKSIYLEPPSKEELVNRIRTRQPGITKEEMANRLLADAHIYDFKLQADYIFPPGKLGEWVDLFKLHSRHS